jgi:AcrR family transcriptional regulator
MTDGPLVVRRRKPDREDTEGRLLAAFETVWNRDGVQGLGVNAVLKEAGVGKSLLYRYFGNFAGLARAWAQRESFLPKAGGRESAATGPAISQAERHVRAAMGYARALRGRPRTRELLAVELLRRSAMTETLDAMRAKFGREMREFVMASGATDNDRAFALSFFVTAALTYLAMRADSVPDYYGLKLDRDSDWQRIEKMLADLAERALAER